MNCKKCQSRRLLFSIHEKPSLNASTFIECLDCGYGWFKSITINMWNNKEIKKKYKVIDK